MKLLRYLFILSFILTIIISQKNIFAQQKPPIITQFNINDEINTITESPDKMNIVFGGKQELSIWHKNYPQRPLSISKKHTEGVQFALFLENGNYLKLVTGGGYTYQNAMFVWERGYYGFTNNYKKSVTIYEELGNENQKPPLNFNEIIENQNSIKAVSCALVIPRKKGEYENVLAIGDLTGRLHFFEVNYKLEKFDLKNPFINPKRKKMGLEPFFDETLKSLSSTIPSKNKYYVRALARQQEDILLIGTGIGSKKVGELIKCEMSNPSKRDVMAQFDSPVAKISVSPDKKFIAVSTDAGELFVYDQNFKLIKQFKNEKYAFPEFSSFKNELAVAKNGKNIEIWEINNNNLQKTQEWEAHTDNITALAWGNDGLYLYSAGKDKNLNTWLTFNIQKNVETLVNAKLDSFLRKDDFEKKADFEVRTSAENQKLFIKKYFELYYTYFSRKIFHALPSKIDYDAETEIARLSGAFSPTFFVKIYPKTARDLKHTLENFLDVFEPKKIIFLPKNALKNPEKIDQNSFLPVLVEGSIEIKSEMGESIEEHKKWKNESVRVLLHKLDIASDFNPNVNTKIATKIISTSQTNTQIAEIDFDIPNIPKNKFLNKDNVAVIIGNKDYQKTQAVDFALNDAQIMKKYLIQTLGYDEKNIIYVENAKSLDFSQIFGTKASPKGKLFNMVKAQKSEVFVYYAGHGAPDLNNEKKSYFVPVDTEMEYIELTAYDTDVFYDNLAQLPAKSITVVIDACFSGEGIYKNISPIRIKSKGAMGLKNGALMASCGADQVSAWYNEKGHSLFTYFFLKAIHNQNADKNKDKKLTISEIFQYIDDQTEGVPYFSRRLHNVQQNPVLKGQNIDKILVEY